jgi:hypothetical protein
MHAATASQHWIPSRLARCCFLNPALSPRPDMPARPAAAHTIPAIKTLLWVLLAHDLCMYVEPAASSSDSWSPWRSSMWAAVLSYLKCLVHPTSSIIHMMSGTSVSMDGSWMPSSRACMINGADQNIFFCETWVDASLRTLILVMNTHISEILSQRIYLEIDEVTTCTLMSKNLCLLNFKSNPEKYEHICQIENLNYTIKNFTIWATLIHIS